MRIGGLALAAAALAGCGGGGSDDSVDVFAASSLRGVLESMDEDAAYTYGGSDELATQIRDGADADLFLSASRVPVASLRRERLVDAPAVFASNRLVVVTAAGPAGVASFRGLARPGLKLVLGAEGVPVGDYAREALAAAGVDAAANVVSLEQDVKGVLGKVALGEADAGVVYETDAIAAGGDVRIVPIPDRFQPTIRYYAAVVRDGDVTAAAALLDRLLGPEGERALLTAGFLPPS